MGIEITKMNNEGIAVILIDGIPAARLLRLYLEGMQVYACQGITVFEGRSWALQRTARTEIMAYLAEGTVPPRIVMADLVNLNKNSCLKFKNTAGAAIRISTLGDVIRHLNDGSLSLELPKGNLQ